MDYSILRNKNEMNKKSCIIGRIKDINFKEDTCTLAINGNENKVRINALIISILSGKLSISNPSLLTNYNFDKHLKNTKKHKEIIKEKIVKELTNSEVSNIKREKLINRKDLLFHGSFNGIEGKISCNRNKCLCDFGNGFYTGDNLRQAENRVANSKESIVYAFTYDFKDYKVYRFNDIVLWAIYVGYNRHIISIDSVELMNKIDYINKHDIIIGYIADDKISAVYNDFLNNNITDVCLAECLKLVKYGKQVVFKNNSAINCIQLYESYVLTNDIKNQSKEWSKKLKAEMDEHIETYKTKFRRDGNYLDEIIGVYKHE